MAKIFLLTKFVRREKKDGKDFTSCQKKMTKIYQVFLGFFLWVFRAYIGCLGRALFCLLSHRKIV